jgi:hypothetical protein
MLYLACHFCRYTLDVLLAAPDGTYFRFFSDHTQQLDLVDLRGPQDLQVTEANSTAPECERRSGVNEYTHNQNTMISRKEEPSSPNEKRKGVQAQPQPCVRRGRVTAHGTAAPWQKSRAHEILCLGGTALCAPSRLPDPGWQRHARFDPRNAFFSPPKSLTKARP